MVRQETSLPYRVSLSIHVRTIWSNYLVIFVVVNGSQHVPNESMLEVHRLWIAGLFVSYLMAIAEESPYKLPAFCKNKRSYAM